MPTDQRRTHLVTYIGEEGEHRRDHVSPQQRDVMKVYLAARYSRHSEMQEVRGVLAGLGCEITSRWVDCHGGKYPGSFTVEQLNADPQYCAAIGRHDLEDLAAAGTVISFTGSGGKGGRHVEFGYALATGKRLIIVGPRENVFHTLPVVEHYHDVPHLLTALDGHDLGDKQRG